MTRDEARQKAIKTAHAAGIKYGCEIIIEELRALDTDIERGNDTTEVIRANIDRRIAAQIKKLEKVAA